MRFELSIKSGHAAFANDPEGEVADILRSVAVKIKDAGLTAGHLYDSNGNFVGGWELVLPDENEAEEA